LASALFGLQIIAAIQKIAAVMKPASEYGSKNAMYSINTQCITSRIGNSGAYRRSSKTSPYGNNEEHLLAWGRTGYPIVDAAMRQMNEIADVQPLHDCRQFPYQND